RCAQAACEVTERDRHPSLLLGFELPAGGCERIVQAIDRAVEHRLVRPLVLEPGGGERSPADVVAGPMGEQPAGERPPELEHTLPARARLPFEAAGEDLP